MSHTKPCEKCAGAGTVSRERRKLADNSLDPADLRHRELCDRCGGSGTLPLDLKTITEKPPGFAADIWGGV